MNQKTVLVIEDDRSFARLAEIILNKKGIKTHLCLDVTNAMEIARRVRPDLIVLDIHMPKRSGMWILKQLQQDETTQGITVIVNSVLTRSKSIEQLKKMGASEFVSKSEGMDALVDKVTSFLEIK